MKKLILSITASLAAGSVFAAEPPKSCIDVIHLMHQQAAAEGKNTASEADLIKALQEEWDKQDAEQRKELAVLCEESLMLMKASQ